MKQYKIVDVYGESKLLEGTLNSLAKDGYKVIATVEGYGFKSHNYSSTERPSRIILEKDIPDLTTPPYR